MNDWESQPRFLSQDRWSPDESAYHGDPWPQIQTTDTLGWTGTTGLQAGQRLLVFLNDRDGWTPGPFPLGEVDADNNVHFQSTQFYCFGLPSAFQDASVDKIRAALSDEPIIKDVDSVSVLSAGTTVYCAHDLNPHPNDTEVDAGL